MRALKQLLRMFTWMAVLGGCAAVLGVVLMIFVRGSGPGAAALVAAGGTTAFAIGWQRQRAKRMIADVEAGTTTLAALARGTQGPPDPAGRWTVFAVGNTMVGIFLSLVALAILPPPWSAPVIAAVGLSVAQTWRVRHRVKTRVVADVAAGTTSRAASAHGWFGRRDLAGRWRVLAVTNTMAGIVVSLVALALFAPPWSAVVVVVMAFSVVETWRMAHLLTTRLSRAKP